MPNWCKNRLSVTGPAAEVDAFVKKAVDKDTKLSFNSFVPRKVNAKKYQNAKENACDGTAYGNPNFNWYSWQIDHWGTKWDCSDATLSVEENGGQKTATYEFDTAWNPPTVFYKAITKKFKTLSFEAYAWESGCSFWCHFVGRDGAVEEDDSMDIDQSELLRDAVIDRLDQLGFDTDSGDIDDLCNNIDCWDVDYSDLSEIPDASVSIYDDEADFIQAAKDAGFKKLRKKKK